MISVKGGGRGAGRLPRRGEFRGGVPRHLLRGYEPEFSESLVPNSSGQPPRAVSQGNLLY